MCICHERYLAISTVVEAYIYGVFYQYENNFTSINNFNSVD